MSKERLEEIKRNIVGIFDMESGRIESVDIRKEDYEWLIEQADRGVEYDRYLISLEDNKHYVTGLEQQNKRYREALEEIKQEGEFMDFRTGRKIYNTQGRIACEALEGRY